MPPPGIAGAPLSFFGLSATMASVVTRSPAIEVYLQRGSNNFGRVNDALGDEVHIFAVLGVEAEKRIDPFPGSCRR